MSTITITGNLTDAPELRFTPSGTAVANFTVAENRGKDDKKETYFHRCQAWEEQAEQIAEHLRKGQRVIVTGDLRQRSYETKEGEKRTVWEVTAWDVGASLKWKPKGGSGSSGGYQRPTTAQTSQAADPWGGGGGTSGSGGFPGSPDEPPFQR